MATTSITKRVKEAREIMEQFKALEKVNAEVYWHRSEKVYRLKRDNMWKLVNGEDRMTWADFCVNELGTPRPTADQKATVYEYFIKRHAFKVEELKDYDVYSLYYIATVKPDASKKTALSWMKKSSGQTRKNFIEEIRGKACDHKEVHVEEEKKQVCDKCRRTVMKLKAKKITLK